MKTLLLTILALFSLQLKAQTWIPVPDVHFQNYLTTHYPAGAFSTSGGNFFIDADHADIQAEDSLDIISLNLSSIEGLQAFENLTYLKCDSNNLTLLPNLPANLIFLSCGYNALTQLPALPASLVDLNCQYNQLTGLPALPGSLLSLWCHYNLLTSLPSFPSSLYMMMCSGNQLTTLPALPNQLNYLWCGENQLTGLPTLPQNLQQLSCNTNHLLSLPVLPNSLVIFFCGENQLTAIPPLPANLQMLDCQSNQLTALPVLPQSMTLLSCSDNNISVLPALPSQLDQLVCNGNQLTELPELPSSLTYFHCYNNYIACFPEFPTSIQMFGIDYNPFTCLPNYIPAMDQHYLDYPLCDANNPDGCLGARGIAGAVFKDVNMNCSHTGGNLTYIPMSVYDTAGTLIVSSTSLVNGNYYFAADSGTYELTVDTAILGPVMQVTCPVGNTSTAVVPFADTVVSGGDFGLVCNGFDLGVQSIVPNGLVFPGQTHDLSILAGDLTAQYQMYCAAGISGEITVSVTGPGAVSFGGSPTSVSGNSAVYSVVDFGVPNATEFLASVLTDTTAVSGQEFCVTVSVSTSVSGDLDNTNNLYIYCYHVVNSYDPNIKETYPELVEPGYTDEFTYTIHFQNTGTAPAMNIRLADTLDPNLDLSTFKVVHASDVFTTTLNPASRLLTVRFPQIMLPDSTTDPEGSIGFIQYRVKPVVGLADGTVIRNTAYIYFDYNAPIVTNTSENLFTESLGLTEFVEETIRLYPNPSDGQVFVQSENGTIEQVLLYDLKGTLVKSVASNTKQTAVDISNLDSGVYLAKIHTNRSIVTKRLIVR